MAQVNQSYLSDDSSDEDDAESFHNDFDSNRASLSDYGTNRASFSLSDFEANRLSFTSENDNPLSDQESTKEFSEFNDNNQFQSESNSEEESKPYIEPNTPPNRTGPVTFYKHGQPPKVVYKPPSCYSNSNKRPQSCSDSEDPDPDQDEMPAKRSKFDSLAQPVQLDTHFDGKANAMMEKMGYKKGEGLGKHSQGRVAPVELSKQRGRRGLGLTLPGLEAADLTWDSSMEVVSIEEVPKWLKGAMLPPLDMHTLQSWQQTGPRNLNIEDFTDFCEPSLLKNVLSKKSIFDSLDGDEMRKARTRSNPFETIGKGMFLNRAAMKMANMDRVFDFMFTAPKTKNQEPMVRQDGLLYFADVCAGPGGFSEYVLWRNKWRAKGFGFTLKGENDFKLSDFISGSCESFEPFYGKKEDGNVFDPENIESLMHFVMDHTQQLGVHFMMADGGFSVDGQENIQELLSKQLYLCQFLVALCIVRTGGHFVCKLFDVFSPFSVGLVYLMYRAFDRISIHKPNTSRPANSERYIICKWKREDCEPTREYLFNLNKELCRLSQSKEDVNYCVSMDELVSDKVFFDYIVESNNVLGERQIVNLVKIAAFCRDMNLQEPRQAEMRRGCLAYWKVPDNARRLDKTTVEDLAHKRLQKCDEPLKSPGTLLKAEDQLEALVKSVYDWHAIPISTKTEMYFYIGLGRNRVFRSSKGGKYWTKAEISSHGSLMMELSPGTMVYGELVQEVEGEFRSQVKKTAFHIIDAISLGNEEIGHLHYAERLKMCELYAEALHKSTRTDLCPLRVKKVFNLQDINQFFQGLTYHIMKNGNRELLLSYDKVAFKPEGIMFFKATKDPWMRHLSRKTNHYYVAMLGAESKYDRDRPTESCSSTIECVNKRLLWLWEMGVGMRQEPAEEGVLHKDQLLNFIGAKLSR